MHVPFLVGDWMADSFALLYFWLWWIGGSQNRKGPFFFSIDVWQPLCSVQLPAAPSCACQEELVRCFRQSSDSCGGFSHLIQPPQRDISCEGFSVRHCWEGCCINSIWARTDLCHLSWTNFFFCILKLEKVTVRRVLYSHRWPPWTGRNMDLSELSGE